MFERCSKNKLQQLTLVSISLCVYWHRGKAVELGAHVCNPWLGLLGPVFRLKSLGANGAFTVLRPCTVLGCTYLVQVVLVSPVFISFRTKFTLAFLTKPSTI